MKTKSTFPSIYFWGSILDDEFCKCNFGWRWASPLLLHLCFAMFFFSPLKLFYFNPLRSFPIFYCTFVLHHVCASLFLEFSLQTWLHEQCKISHPKFSYIMMFDNSINQMINHLIILKVPCVFPKCCTCKILHMSIHLWAWITLLYRPQVHFRSFTVCLQ